MGSFGRSFFGYRRPEVDAAISARDSRIDRLRLEVKASAETAAEMEAEVTALSGMVIEREREIRGLNEQLREASEQANRNLDALSVAGERMKEVEAQARGQATRIRMKALREAVEISRRVKDVAEAESSVNGATNGHADADPQEIFKGLVKVDIGPLGDFSQLVGLENAVSQLGATQISVESFSEGRAKLAISLDEPVDLLRELEERSSLEFRVRRAADDNLILDVDDDPGPEQRAA